MPSLEDLSATQEYDETVAEFSQDLLFLRSEWDRMKQKSEGVDERLMVMDKTLVMYEKRFDSLDHRFDQLTQILHRMETNQMSEKSQGKAVASPSNEQTPPLQSSSRLWVREFITKFLTLPWRNKGLLTRGLISSVLHSRKLNVMPSSENASGEALVEA
ncbi:hypothetical protein F2Q70_00037112 [Brassica cretica]|uniref:Uncharacterized protein n=1 Tax=Brassica cretica TaxID=69181 RepID=A0A8S9JR36_BRACR|nr:hypothetical protein F2Q70_00037112 [Brassica cretica]KAF3529380.1 hypothetical protein DY000_02042695 [Brassica cretica]